MKKDKDPIGQRMKQYETSVGPVLVQRMPAIIRIDGRAFHTYTRFFKKPFDRLLMKVMQQTAIELCQSISNSVMAYGQSDEISILLVDYKNVNTQQWFGGKVQKIVSVAASIATAAFNKTMLSQMFIDSMHSPKVSDFVYNNSATFDARVFNVPKEDVGNYFYWRYLDAQRNSVSALAQSVFSHKILQGVSCEQMKQMLIDCKEPWEKIPSHYRNGWLAEKSEDIVYGEHGGWVEGPWQIMEIEDDIRETALVKAGAYGGAYA